jgi:hypothetical protein
VARVTCACSTSCHRSLCVIGLVLRLYEMTTTFDCSDYENNERNEGPESPRDCSQSMEPPTVQKTKGSQFRTFAAVLADADCRELSDI